MFDKMKQMKQMRDIQKAMQAERIEAEREGVRVVMDGSFDVQEIKLNPELETDRQEKLIKEVLAEARQKVQKQLAAKFGGMM